MANDPQPEVLQEQGDRRVLHCDMDCFFAAVHVRDDPALAGRPVLVGGEPGGRGVVAAANYEARAYGVRSAMPSTRAQLLCPQAVFLRPDFPLYRAESEKVFEIFRDISPLVQGVSIDEAYLDVTPCLEAWGTATGVAREVRRRVFEERGLTVSVGVGPNKLIAKIASDHDKPDGLTVVPPAKVADFLASLSIRSLPGVGPVTEAAMHRLGIRRVRDLRDWEEEKLTQRFGRYGRSLFRFARGLDRRPISLSRRRKSLSSERTYATDLRELDEIETEVGRLAECVSRGLASKELIARTVSVKVRYSDYSTITRARTLALPTSDAGTLFEAVLTLLRKTEVGSRPVRLLGVGCSNLDAASQGQLMLFAS